MYPLFEFKLSAKTFLLLQPLSVDKGLIKSLQFNVVPLTVSLVRQGLVKLTTYSSVLWSIISVRLDEQSIG